MGRFAREGLAAFASNAPLASCGCGLHVGGRNTSTVLLPSSIPASASFAGVGAPVTAVPSHRPVQSHPDASSCQPKDASPPISRSFEQDVESQHSLIEGVRGAQTVGRKNRYGSLDGGLGPWCRASHGSRGAVKGIYGRHGMGTGQRAGPIWTAWGTEVVPGSSAGGRPGSDHAV